MNGLLINAFVMCVFGTDPIPIPTTPALKTIEVLKTVSLPNDEEKIEVNFYKGKGSEKKAKLYATNFAWARGRIGLDGEEPTCSNITQKEAETFIVTVRYEDTKTYPMSAVQAIGPLVYEDDFLVTPITIYQSPSEMKSVAAGVKIWLVYAEVKFEEEWKQFHKEHPLEFSLKQGIVLDSSKNSDSFTFRSPRNLRKASPMVTSK